MRYLTVLIIISGLLLIDASIFPASSSAQTSAQEKAANLRAQLSEVETKQAELQTRLQKLDEDSKPENIEKSLAGVGSTHPEELRELKRRQLETQKAAVQKQLNWANASVGRLEKGVADAEAAAYHDSAKGTTDQRVSDLTQPLGSDNGIQASVSGGRVRSAKKTKAKRHRVKS